MWVFLADQQQVGLSLHDDVLPSSTAAGAASQLPATELVGGVRRLSLLGNEVAVTSDSEGADEEGDDAEGSDLDLSDDDFEAVDAGDIDEELLEQEIAKELQEDDDSL